MTTPISARARWSVSCPTSLSSDTAPSFMLSATDGSKYLFAGCPENTTRAATQDRIALRRLKSVFLSSAVDIQTTSGLGGLLLTLGDKDGSKIEVHGPEGTDHLLASMRFHTRRQKLSLRLHQYRRPIAGSGAYSQMGESADNEAQPAFQDANITVWAEPVLPEGWVGASDAQLPARRRRSSSAARTTGARKNGRRSTSPTTSGNVESVANQAETTEHVEAEVSSSPEDLDWFARDFQPSQLEGARAAKWRSMIISDMFRSGARYVAQPHKDRWLASPAWNTSPLPPCEVPPIAVSYLVIGPEVRGQFLPEEAKKQGIKPGPDFSKITKGEEVLLPDGTALDISKCFTPGAPSSAFAIIYCPNKDYISSLLSRNPLRRLTAKSELRYVFHYLGPGVLDNEAYINWLSFLPRDVRHVVSAPGYVADRIAFSSATILQLRLSRMGRQMFPLPHYELDPKRKLHDLAGLLINVQPLYMGSTFELSAALTKPDEPPSKGRTFDFLPDSAEAQAVEVKLGDLPAEAAQARAEETWKDYLRLVDEARAIIAVEEQSHEVGKDKPGADIRVIPLGTGSALPSKYRNVSSTVLELEDSQIALLDAGEGTSGQLARHYGHGPAGLSDFYSRLRLVFISHMHADHHSGLAALLSSRSQTLLLADGSASDKLEPLYIACPPQTRTYIRDMNALHSLGLDNAQVPVEFVDCHHLLEKKREDSRYASLYSALLLKKAETVLVEHRTKAFGLVLEGETGWKIVYSGDTQPCKALVEAGKDATLLIHEATIEDDMPEVAASKGHSTFAQAIQVAKEMRAKHCLLTHFSQRYPKFPPLSENQDSDATSCHIAVAFDLMSLRIRDFWKFRHFIKSFERLFSEMEADDPADAAEETASINGKDAKATAKQKAKENWKNQKEQAAAKKGKKGKEINGQAVVDAVTVA